MSQENVEIVRSIYTMWERGDFTSAAWAHPEPSTCPPAGPPEVSPDDPEPTP